MWPPQWDAGMATPDHTPMGRGYHSALHYFHHANDYWSMATGQCLPPTRQRACQAGNYTTFCAEGSPDVPYTQLFSDTADDCCDLCSQHSDCAAFVWGLTFNATLGQHSCHLKTQIKQKKPGNCSAACIAEGGCGSREAVNVVDLWLTPGDGSEGPAHGCVDVTCSSCLSDVTSSRSKNRRRLTLLGTYSPTATIGTTTRASPATRPVQSLRHAPLARRATRGTAATKTLSLSSMCWTLSKRTTPRTPCSYSGHVCLVLACARVASE